VNFDNRHEGIGDVERIKVWTHFKFAARGDKYSSMKWHWWHFNSINHNMYKPHHNTIYRFKDKQFATAVDQAYGNYDFLMACNIDVKNEEVCQEFKKWGEWFLDTTGVDGFRLDAVKHIHTDFFHDWLNHISQYAKKNLFMVGEYWSEDVKALHWFISETGGKLSLFDVPLHYNFYSASRSQGDYNMENILQGTLMTEQPDLAVTFVENHDSQPLQALESYVEPWFKPLAYAIILLRREGYPCVFYGDYYGAHYVDKGPDGKEYEIWLPSHRVLIDKFLFARQNFAYGEQYDYLDHFNTIGWTRLGDQDHPKAMAVLMSDGPDGSKMMEVKKPNATFIDITENIKEPIQTNESGWGNFLCNGGSVSVWIEQ
jgi:alpha-amylase